MFKPLKSCVADAHVLKGDVPKTIQSMSIKPLNVYTAYKISFSLMSMKLSFLIIALGYVWSSLLKKRIDIIQR